MASECGAFIHALHSSGSVRITGIAFGCMGATTAFGAAVRKPYRSFKVSPSFSFLTDVQRVQMPAKNPTGLSSLRANHTGSGGFPAYSEKLVKGTRQRFLTPYTRLLSNSSAMSSRACSIRAMSISEVPG